MSYHDDILEHCISRINTSTNSNNKKINFKKATSRLSELNDNYKKLSLANFSSEENLNDDQMPLEKILEEIEKIENKIHKLSDSDLEVVIQNLLKYKKYIHDYEKLCLDYKNEIYVVKCTIDEIIIEDVSDAFL